MTIKGKKRGNGANTALRLINDYLEYLSMADLEGIRTTKIELVRLLCATNYAHGLGVLNALMALGYIEEITSQDKKWVRITSKGINRERR